MAQRFVRNLKRHVKAKLQQRAARHGCSMEAEMEIRDILRTAAHQWEPPPGGLGSEIAALFAECARDFEIPELRGNPVGAVTFGE
ncbi:MAG TPA: hypothetical protein VFW75_16635 [Acetobacteraceae bacterium]|nr:hypothetical protein [Acetobacteraceae bacterium]